jgi:glycosyltransferase involved in cell wall biosynthesis
MAISIWIIMSGEPLEMFGERPHRVGMLSKMLIDKGHSVQWFTTSYDHQYKKYLYKKTTKVMGKHGVKMHFLHSKTKYIKNISYARIKNHLEVANEFNRIANKLQTPDVIFCAYPTIDLAFEATKFSVENNIPVVIDIRDLWPRIFLTPFPRVFRPLADIFLYQYNKKSKYVFENCTSITAVSEKYLHYGLDIGKRSKSGIDCVYPLAFNRSILKNSLESDLNNKYSKFGLDIKRTIIWFVGTFGQTYDLATIIKAANKMKDRDDVQFVFTGDGEMAKDWVSLAEGNPYILFTGWVNSDELTYLSSVANIGLMAYKKGAPQGLPNKIFEYLSAGVPILSSLKGEAESLLQKKGVGLSYEAGNAEDFLKKLKEYTDSNELMQKTSNKCLSLYKRSFSAQTVYGDLSNYLEEMAKQYEDC